MGIFFHSQTTISLYWVLRIQGGFDISVDSFRDGAPVYLDPCDSRQSDPWHCWPYPEFRLWETFGSNKMKPQNIPNITNNWAMGHNGYVQNLGTREKIVTQKIAKIGPILWNWWCPVKPEQQKWRVSSKCGDKKMLVRVFYTSMENESEQPCTKLQLSTSCQDDWREKNCKIFHQNWPRLFCLDAALQKLTTWIPNALSATCKIGCATLTKPNNGSHNLVFDRNKLWVFVRETWIKNITRQEPAKTF